MDADGVTHVWAADSFVNALGVAPENKLGKLLAKYPRRRISGGRLRLQRPHLHGRQSGGLRRRHADLIFPLFFRNRTAVCFPHRRRSLLLPDSPAACRIKTAPVSRRAAGSRRGSIVLFVLSHRLCQKVSPYRSLRAEYAVSPASLSSNSPNRGSGAAHAGAQRAIPQQQALMERFRWP